MTDKALAVMTPFHVLALESVIRDARFDLDLLHDIESLVRYLVAHPERLAGEDEVVVKLEEIDAALVKEGERLDGTIPITGIWLRRIGPDVQVFVEVEGDWYNAITELHDGFFSHIANVRGIRDWPKLANAEPLAGSPTAQESPPK